MNNINIVTNNAIEKELSYLRDRKLEMRYFRKHADKMINSLAKEVVNSKLNTKSRSNFLIVIILRSAISMLPAFIHHFPDAEIGIAGVRRDEKTAIPFEYYWNMPKEIKGKSVIIPDPMLATGGSALHVMDKLTDLGIDDFNVVSLIAAPEGIKAIGKKFPSVNIFTASIDTGLDKNKFIVPGLGDFGDRYFGT
jgi:uracil phosphoribosyltransferase